ncbi:unnamed protein product [Fraxinus pennsylvanica]|uniref:Uncharacterized protein n=1 Tax=Fraxinus pennsylvanica TaxID=56036 RepID=A0AAD2DTJ7_9LAMI|nr:unnamed protein product [Fraxinus pennsylvanica]
MLLTLRSRLLNFQVSSMFRSILRSLKSHPPSLSFGTSTSQQLNCCHASSVKGQRPMALSEAVKFVQTIVFVPPGVNPGDITDDVILPGSNIMLGPYASDAKIKDVDFMKSSNRPKDCPKDDRPKFAMLDASVPPQKIDLDSANWLGRNNISITFVFTKCDKMKGGKGRRSDENIRNFLELIKENYRYHPPWDND